MPRSVDLGFLVQSNIADEAEQCPAAWRTLLSLRSVAAVCGASHTVLQALFGTACSGSADALEAHAACVELCACLQAAAAAAARGSAGTGAAPASAQASQVWVPSLAELWQCLLRLGYQPAGSTCTSTGDGGGSGGAGPQQVTPGSSEALPEQPRVLSSLPAGSGSLKLLLQVLLQVCQLQLAGLSVWDFAMHKVSAGAVMSCTTQCEHFCGKKIGCEGCLLWLRMMMRMRSAVAKFPECHNFISQDS